MPDPVNNISYLTSLSGPIPIPMADRQQDSIKQVIDSIPDDNLYLKNNPEIHSAIARYMIDGADAITEEEKRQISNAIKAGKLPKDLELKGWEKVFANDKEMAEYAQKGYDTLNDAAEVTKDFQVKLEKEMSDFAEAKDWMQKSVDFTDAALEKLGYEKGESYRNPEDFINWGDPKDVDKFESADMLGKFKYLMGTLGGYADVFIKNTIEFPTKGIQQIYEGNPKKIMYGMNGPVNPETWKEKSKRIATNALMILKPIANMSVLLGLDVTKPVGSAAWEQARAEFYADPITHGMIFAEPFRRVGGKYAKMVDAKKAAIEKQAQAERAAAEQAKTQPAQTPPVEPKPVEAPPEAMVETVKDVPKPEGAGDLRIKLGEIDPVVESIRNATKGELAAEMQQLHPNIPPEKINAMTRGEMEYIVSGGRIPMPSEASIRAASESGYLKFMGESAKKAGEKIPEIQKSLETVGKQRVIEAKKVTDAKAKVAEKRGAIPEGDVIKPEATYEAGREVMVPVEDIKVDPERFQPRETEFSERTASSIAEDLDTKGALDPIIVWKDPATGESIVISGHSRFEGLRRRGENNIPVRFYHGTEAEAVMYAHGAANLNQTAMTLREQYNSYQKVKGMGVPREKLEGQYGKREVNLYENMSGLSEGGKFIENLTGSMIEGPMPHIKKWASEVGRMRNQYGDKLTAYHENQIFDYLYKDKKPNYNMSIDEFRKVIDTQMMDAMRTPEQPLALGQEMKVGTDARADTGWIEDQIKEQRAIIAKAKNMADNAETSSEILVQQKIMADAKAEIARLKGGIQELVEKQGDIFAEAAKVPDDTPAGRTGNAAIDASRNVAHQKSTVEVAEQALAKATKPEDIARFKADLEKAQNDLIQYEQEFERQRALARAEKTGEPGRLSKMAEDAKADLKNMAEESKNTLQSGGLFDLPRAAKNWAIIGADLIQQGHKSFKKWSKQIEGMEGFDERLRENLPTIFKESQVQVLKAAAKAKENQEIAEAQYLDIVGETKAEKVGGHLKSKEWERNYTERQREDAGAIVEGIDNIITGEKPVRTKEVIKLVEDYTNAQEIARQNVNEYLKNISEDDYIRFLENYLPHFYRAKNQGMFNGRVNSRLLNSPNAKVRSLPTLKDAMAAGLEPLSQDVAFLHRKWNEINWTVAMNKQVANLLKNSITSDGMPGVIAQFNQPGKGWIRSDHYALRKVTGRKLPDKWALVESGKSKAVKLFGDKAAAQNALSNLQTRDLLGQEVFSVEKRPQGTAYSSENVWVSPEFKRIAKMAFDNPLANRSRLMMAYDIGSSVGKVAELSFSLFHAYSLMESAQAVLAGGKNPIRGAFLFGNEARAIRGRPIEFTPNAGNYLLKNHPEMVKEAVKHHIELAAAAEDLGYNHISRFFRNIEASQRGGVPGVSFGARFARKAFDVPQKFLWEYLHPALKMYSWYHLNKEISLELSKYPGVDAKLLHDLKNTTAEFLNDAYGGQAWETHLWMEPKHLIMARRAFLAPDWTLSNIRIADPTVAYKSVQKTLKAKGNLTPEAQIAAMIANKRTRLQSRYWRNMFATLFVGTQAANYLTTGHFTWDNEYGHKTDIDVTPIVKSVKTLHGKLFNTDYDPETDQQRYFTRLGKQTREPLGWIMDPAKTFGHKMNPLAQQIFRQAANHDFGSDFPAPWTKEGMTFGEKTKARIIDAAMVFKPFSFSDTQFAFALPMMKGMTPYKAIKNYQEALDAREWVIAGRHVLKEEAIRAINDAAVLNGLDGKDLFRTALYGVRKNYMDRYFNSLEKQEWDDVDAAAEKIINLDGTFENVYRSLVNRGASMDQIMEAYSRWAVDKQIEVGARGGLYNDIIGLDKVIQQDMDQKLKEFNDKFHRK